jgi:GNAT superfamily N-acetyltransferase
MCAATNGYRQEHLQPEGEVPVGLRIVLVDDWHEQWPQVLNQIERAGHRDDVRLTDSGYLSARENVLVAVIGDRVAGHLSFHVQPGPGPDPTGERPCVEAEVDSYAIEPDFRNRGIERVLKATAIERAKELRCGEMKGFDLAESWS